MTIEKISGTISGTVYLTRLNDTGTSKLSLIYEVREEPSATNAEHTRRHAQ
jgi:hypothetical protein